MIIPWITLGVSLASLAVTLFLLWVLAVQKQEEDSTYAIGFRYQAEPIEVEDPEDGC